MSSDQSLYFYEVRQRNYYRNLFFDQRIDAAIWSSATGTGTGSKKRPHFRRGHVRRLKSGKRIRIRSMLIHAESKVETPQYKVV
jgi:hypothetical protein